ncbi:MAG TPA: NAD(+)/NADH kinase [Acidimicrobiales bacterium]|nr:NAD(+)/NADH kinase [Acidimicrobiales bacterium]
MSVVGVVLHRDRSEAVLLAKRAIAWLAERGHEVRIPATDAAAVDLPELACPEDTLCDSLALAVSLGGDGTMLRTVDLVAGSGVPILGINVGRLGYLPECEPDDLEAALERFFGGDYVTEERMTLEVGSDGKFPTVSALNEAWLEKTVPGHTVHMRLAIAGSWFTTYAADGLIVSTPTGSTAYNLSVRGPIVSPTLRAMVVKPVSPHQLFDFPLVLGPDEEVRIEVLEGRTATLLVDGRNIGELVPGDAVTCRAGPHPAHLVRFGERDFHQILKAKFGLTDR